MDRSGLVGEDGATHHGVLDISYLRCIQNIIISAHGNSIRSIVMYLLNISQEDILKTEIGWCEPWIISFDGSGKIAQHQIITRDSEPSKSHLFIN